MTNRNEDRSTWAIGAGVIIGLGIGFFLLPLSPLYFVGSMLAGLGLGILVASAISRKKE